ncbi:uncharacterized protein Z518_03939 [Rhinocladiella mackenziei CBS 650.93]|uniref:WLM domain-containing protein n=1 Tax=Rhinocladiella mackenziei CBS 650.93 TaxID=1442369 RepID=A0A0D2JA18_9EURO|nr:uncharacterized protein Z518_03939 [Rhinocladiella mackenziei CBS 650.93]KIX05965.1 hypothetical protein Z518_03939 [Rhinocladiella mackenziei CBS 650.93]
MPLNTLRLNHQKSSHPNDRIVFIKPLPRPPSDQASYDLADTFLHAIAAQCLPIMKNHYLSVTTLEEYEPNPEFIGRNFNNGEIIQLVLRSKSGAWVPFNMVQMVMMHELAHNSHMNHGRDFWKTRNLYAEEMKGLWSRGYTGEGFWGSGRTLTDMDAVMGNNVLSSEELQGLPICGGTYRSRRKKRKAPTQDRPQLTWKEKQERRIEKKFGRNGVALGEDEDKRLHLEINRKGPIGGKPRVAQSKRGRELRAAAALARFETDKKEVADLQRRGRNDSSDNGIDHSGGDGDDYGDVDVDADQEDATDVNGQKLLDSHGHGMVRVRDDEGTNDINLQHEIQEMGLLDRYFKRFQNHINPQRSNREADGDARTESTPKSDTDVGGGASASHSDPATGAQITILDGHERGNSPGHGNELILEHDQSSIQLESSTPKTSAWSRRPLTPAWPDSDKTSSFDEEPATQNQNDSPATGLTPVPVLKLRPESESKTSRTAPSSSTESTTEQTIRPVITSARSQSPSLLWSPVINCPICSLENHRLNVICTACSHVLDLQKDPRCWSCQSEACRTSDSSYLNPGDAGVCGICGMRRNNV